MKEKLTKFLKLLPADQDCFRQLHLCQVRQDHQEPQRVDRRQADGAGGGHHGLGEGQSHHRRLEVVHGHGYLAARSHEHRNVF